MTTAKRNPDFRRREFLRATGIAAGLVPFLAGERALRGAEQPKRLLVIASANAWVHDGFLPKAPAGALASLALPDGIKPLEPHKADVNVIAGLEYRNYKAFYPSNVNYVDCHHSLPHLLTGKIGVMGKNSSSRPQDGATGYRPAGGGPSIDQWYADWLRSKGVTLPFQCLTAGVQDESCCEPTMVQLSYRGPDQPNAVENNPYTLNTRLFANVGMSATDIDKVRAERRSVLDGVGKMIERFAKNLGTEDRERVQQHLQSVRSVENSLGASAGAGCTKPSVGGAIDIGSNANVPKLVDAQISNVITALACDLTRSATLTLANGGGGWFPAWLNNPDFNGAPLAGNAGNNRNHHDLAHASANSAEARRLKTILEAWFMQQFATIIARLKEVKEGSGTMLDNTIVLWVNNMGTGDHSWQHAVWLTAGRAGGFRSGQWLPLGEWATKGMQGACVPQNGVLTAVANALTGSSMTSFGDAQFGGEAPGLRA